MRRFHTLAFLAVLVLSACATNPPPPASSAPPSEAAVGDASITATDVRTHVEFLASDELMGRDTPSPGLERAADYIANAFGSYGLEPAGDDGSYLQRFPLSVTRLDEAATRVTWTSGDETGAWSFSEDFFVVPTSADEAAGRAFYSGVPSALSGDLPADAAGGVVFFSIPGLPAQTPGWDQEAMQAVAHAQQAGAAGLVLLLDPDLGRDEMAKLEHELGGRARMPFSVPVVVMRQGAAADLFARTGADLAMLRDRPETLPVTAGDALVEIHTEIVEDEHYPANVVAVLPGSDPELRDSYVVFSAHYDHVGVGEPDATGDTVYNGADDNASGTAALMELAQAYASLPTPPARSLVFLAVSGEEKGLLGSAYYADHPTVPAEQIVANVNMDMIGRNAPDSVRAIGQEYTSMGAVAQRVAAEHPDLGLVVAYDEHPEERHFFRSDHFNFVRKGIPAIFFNAGTHEDYHQASDELSKLDVDKTVRVARLIYHLGEAVASESAAPQWTAEGQEVVDGIMQRYGTR
jgi:hypothetical protein